MVPLKIHFSSFQGTFTGCSQNVQVIHNTGKRAREVPGEVAGPAELWAEPQVPRAPRCTAVPQSPLQGGHEGWLSTQLTTSSYKTLLWVEAFILWDCSGPQGCSSAQGRPKQALGAVGGSQLVQCVAVLALLQGGSPRQGDSTPGQTQLGHSDRPSLKAKVMAVTKEPGGFQGQGKNNLSISSTAPGRVLLLLQKGSVRKFKKNFLSSPHKQICWGSRNYHFAMEHLFVIS